MGGVLDRSQGVLAGFFGDVTVPFQTGESREGSFFEFQGGLEVKQNVWFGRLVDLDGFPEYLVPIPGQKLPFLYVTSYGGDGYDLRDLDGVMSDVYRSAQVSNAPPLFPNGHQIVSPGFDSKYGVGGYLDRQNEVAWLTKDLVAEADNFTNLTASTLSPSHTHWPRHWSPELIVFVASCVVAGVITILSVAFLLCGKLHLGEFLVIGSIILILVWRLFSTLR